MKALGVRKLRPALEKVIEVLEKGSPGDPTSLVLVAPTGYGKTSLTPELFRRLSASEAWPPAVVHSLPLKAIVEQAFRRFSEELRDEATVGVQAHGVSSSRSPFMASDVVVSTFDSFLLNLLRVNVAERGLGHYEVPRSFLFTSFIVLDEVHVAFMREDKATTSALIAACGVLAKARVPALVATATLSGGQLEALASTTRGPVAMVVPVPDEKVAEMVRGLMERPGLRVEPVVDRGFYEGAAEVAWRFEMVREDEAGSVLLSEAGRGLRVLRVVKSVRRAIEEYHRYRDELGDDRVALLHARMTPRDRRAQLERAEKGASPGVLVGTSAIEAGVDLSFDVLVTDECSIESLVQRCGRVARHGRPRDGEARVYAVVAGEGPFQEMVRELSARRVNPRLPWAWRGQEGYWKLLERFGTQEGGVDPRLVDRLESLALRPLMPMGVERAKDELQSMCRLVRDTVLVPVVPHHEDLGYPSYEDLLKDLSDLVLPLELETVASGRLLDCDAESCHVIVYAQGDREMTADVRKAPAKHVREALSSCREAARTLEVGIKDIGVPLAFVLRKGCYEPGEGMVCDGYAWMVS